MPPWTIDQARETYHLSHWGNGYIDIDTQGHVIVRPAGDRRDEIIDLHALTQDLQDRGLSTPVLARFTDILHHRVDMLYEAFSRAMRQHDYQADYTAAYPLKVNQQRSVVEEILKRGDVQVGLEAGSKPELLAVLALAGASGGLIICNGYKDREYIRLALIGRLLGKRIYIVIEKLCELEMVLEVSRELNVSPLIGVRVRLASLGKGKWQNTGGEKSKFGFSTAQLLQLTSRLQALNMLDAMQLLHVHLGSQIANIRDIQRGMREAARCYAELRRLGMNIDCVDVGGGLGVDYEGSRSRSFCSTNYSIDEYANNVVHSLWEICAEQALPHPAIVTEAGRAMTAHHAVLISNVIDVEQVSAPAVEMKLPEDASQVIRDLYQVLQDLPKCSLVESFHDAGYFLALSQDMYLHGLLSLEQRALTERLYYSICRRLHPLLKPSKHAHREVLDELHEKLADKYFCNFSIFQSLPDVWAIDQIFPVLPLQRLDEHPGRRVVIADITCDSDGRMDQYVAGEGIATTLPLHALNPGEDYLLGFFLVGAYQEILGDMHNLFGDTHAVNVALCDGGYQLVQTQQGDRIADVLRTVHYDPNELMDFLQGKIQLAELDEGQRRICQETLRAGLQAYTYLKKD